MAPVAETSDNMELDSSAYSLVMGSQEGLLTLSPCRAQELVAPDPLEQWYAVENQPFARGKFAAVKRCRLLSTNEEFAAKVIRKRRRGAGLSPESLHEAAVLDLCRQCPHIVCLEKVFDAPGETVLVLQLAKGGELQSILDRDEVPEQRDVIRFLRQVLEGLAFLHKWNIAHLDLKPQNLVLTGSFPDCDIKLCDFGIARHIARGADMREILGTPDYVAPEVLNYEPISLATDMWSVGVLAYVLLTGCTPFGGDSKQETYCNITRCQLEFPDDLFQDVTPSAIQFISSLLVSDPSLRLTAQQCLEHPWLRGGSSVDCVPCLLSSSDESCISSSTSTIVPDDDETDVGNSFDDNLEETVVQANETNDCPEPKTPVNTAVKSAVAPCKTGYKETLSVLDEDSCEPLTSFTVTRRAGSLPLRWPSSRREVQYDRASDLGYGSDCVSEISSTDSSSDRSSIISLDDSPLEWAQHAMRRYSDTSQAAERLWRRAWERFLPATAGTCVSLPHHLFREGSPSAVGREVSSPGSHSQEGNQNRPWEKVCTGSLARAMERFNSPPSSSNMMSGELSKSTASLNLPVKPAAKVSEVKTRLFSGSHPQSGMKTMQALSSRPPLVHLDKTEIVKSRLVKFRTATNTTP